MKVCIDISALNWEKSGISRYIKHILQDFATINSSSDCEIVLLSNKHHNLFDKSNDYTLKIFQVPSLIYKAILPLLVKRENADVFYSPTSELFLPKLTTTVLVFHDLAPEVHPNWFPLKIRLYKYLRLYYLSAKLADKIIVPSISTKNDIINMYGIKDDKIHVIYHGIDEQFKPIDKIKARQTLENSLKIDYPFIFHIDTVRITSLLSAFAKLKKEKNIPHKLVLLGNFSDPLHNPFELSEKLGIKDDVIIIGKTVSDEELIALYNLAELFIFPSFYEGFGFPPLESMACGTPVIVSNTTSLPEVVADAGIIVDPTDVNTIANAIHKVLSDDDLRKDLSKKGLIRARSFTWKDSSTATFELIQRVAILDNRNI